jgi:hypothetical protein
VSGSAPLAAATITGMAAVVRRSARSSIAARSARAAAPEGETRGPLLAGALHGSRQHLARQRQIDRALRLARRHLQRTVDDGLDLIGVAQLVVPFHRLAHHAGLIEHFLRPVNSRVAHTEGAGLEQRRAACGDEERNLIAGGVHHPAHRIRGPTLTWNMTACGRPVIRYAPCAMPMARFS